jgi:hypothetical protein
VATPGHTYLAGAGYSNQVYGFGAVYAYGVRGSSTAAYLYDGPGRNTFTGSRNNGTLAGADYFVSVNDFAAVTVLATQGSGDHRSVGAVDYVLGMFGWWW